MWKQRTKTMALDPQDLEGRIEDTVHFDEYKPKMGKDDAIIVATFKVFGKQPAYDLENFIEKGYNFVLDADATPGEQSDGTYKVFVEIERDRHIADNIYEIIDGIKRLSEMDEFRFRYYKNFKSRELTHEALVDSIPTDPDTYDIKVNLK